MGEAREGVVFHSNWHLSCFINMKSNLRVQMGCRPLCLLLEWHAIYQPQKGGLRNETFGGWVTEGNDWRAMNELVIFSYRIGRKPRHGWQWSPSRLQPVGWTVTSSKKVTFPRPWAENKSWRITRYTETFPRRQGHSYCGGSWSHTAAVSCPICNIRRAACETKYKIWVWKTPASSRIFSSRNGVFTTALP